MVLFISGLLLIVVVSKWAWTEPKPQHEPTIIERLVEFVCLTPLCCWVITVWVGFVTWLFFIGDNGSLFADFYHYGTFPLGLLVAANLAFVLVNRSTWQMGPHLGISLIAVCMFSFTNYSILPEWDGIRPDQAALRIAQRRPVVSNQKIVPPGQYSLVLTENPRRGGPFSDFDRTFLVIGPNQDAIGRVVVRPFFPFYWTRKRLDDYTFAEEELQKADTMGELLLILDKYPRSKAAAVAEKKLDKLFEPRPGR